MNNAKLVGLLIRALDRMKLINGEDSNCVTDPSLCENHKLIHEIEDILKGK